MTRAVETSVEPVDPRAPEVARLLDALTADLADAGYTAAETFGYSVDDLLVHDVHLVGAYRHGVLVGVAGLERQTSDTGELKRFYVVPGARGTGAADRLLDHLLRHAATAGVRRVRLETGAHQQPALRFYRRRGFVDIDRFGPYVDSATSVCLQRDLTLADPAPA